MQSYTNHQVSTDDYYIGLTQLLLQKKHQFYLLEVC